MPELPYGRVPYPLRPGPSIRGLEPLPTPTRHDPASTIAAADPPAIATPAPTIKVEHRGRIRADGVAIARSAMAAIVAMSRPEPTRSGNTGSAGRGRRPSRGWPRPLRFEASS